MIFFFIMPSGLYFEYFIIKSSEEQNPLSSPNPYLPSTICERSLSPHSVICCIICIYCGLFPNRLLLSPTHSYLRTFFIMLILYYMVTSDIDFHPQLFFKSFLPAYSSKWPGASWRGWVWWFSPVLLHLGGRDRGLRVLSCGVVVCAHVQGENLSCPFSSTVQLERTERHCLFAMELSKPSRLTGQCTLGILLFVSISPVP